MTCSNVQNGALSVGHVGNVFGIRDDVAQTSICRIRASNHTEAQAFRVGSWMPIQQRYSSHKGEGYRAGF
jgi:hypothetical protein